MTCLPSPAAIYENCTGGLSEATGAYALRMKISVIIPTYNAEPFLGDALRSVFAQTRQPDEVLVVDDCSTDRSRDVARTFPVTLLSTQHNSGHAAARNLGIAAATGDVLVWIDADDLFEPNHIDVVCGLLETYSDAHVSFSGVRYFGARTELWTNFPCSAGPRRIFRECFERTVVPAISAATRRDALISVGGFDESIRIAPDFDFWLRLSRQYQFVST